MAGALLGVVDDDDGLADQLDRLGGAANVENCRARAATGLGAWVAGSSAFPGVERLHRRGTKNLDGVAALQLRR